MTKVLSILGTLPYKTTFPAEFVMKLVPHRPICRHKNITLQTNTNVVLFQNCGQIGQITIFFAKIWKKQNKTKQKTFSIFFFYYFIFSCQAYPMVRQLAKKKKKKKIRPKKKHEKAHAKVVKCAKKKNKCWFPGPPVT